MTKLTLISFATCPFVQRAMVSLNEKQVPFELVHIDLANKPDWFLAISPLGKVPVLKVEPEGREAVYIFESSVILEYLDEAMPGPRLHPEDALERARHRAWMEVSSQVLGDLYRYTMAATSEETDAARQSLNVKLAQVETTLVGPFFAGATFSNVDVAFSSAFRQIDVLAGAVNTDLTAGFPKLTEWRKTLASRPSVRDGAPKDFAENYLSSLRARNAGILNR